jgi:outer membrane autotransporter protein
MRRPFALLVVSILAAPAARADGSIALNARAGVAKPFGDFGNGIALADSVEWGFPLQADLQFRFAKQLSVGAYGRYAATTLASKTSDACTAFSCKLADIGFGAIAEYRFSDRLEGGPWIGALVGYEMLRGDISSGGSTPTKVSSKTSGFEAGAQVGVDFELGGVTIGPWGSLQFGQFSKTKVGSSSTTIADKGLHGWVQVGLRLSLLL